MRIGSKVYIDGYTSMAQQNARESKIEKIETRYDELTGEPFEVYLVDDEWYDSRDGGCYSNKNSMYYIEFDEVADYLQSKEFQQSFHERVKRDTWGNGTPMIYMDDNKNIISHWENGTKDILNSKHELTDKEFHVDMGSTPIHLKVVFVSTNEDITVKYLSSTPNRFERFNINDFKQLTGWVEAN